MSCEMVTAKTTHLPEVITGVWPHGLGRRCLLLGSSSHVLQASTTPYVVGAFFVTRPHHIDANH